MPGFFLPIYGWLFLLLGPLVVFYFLKLRRPRMTIPSLVLWQRVMRDSRVNAPFQRFRRNILLLLQILLLCLLVMAAMQPYFRGSEETARRLPILIDRSASMAAVSAAGGPTRLDLARERVEEVIDNLASDQEVSLIAFGRSAERLADFTNNKRVLREALESIEIEDVASELELALRMVEAKARTSAIDRVVLLTDGNVPGEVDFALPFKLDYRKLPAGGQNMGITDLRARRAPDGGWHVFVNVEGTAAEPMSGVVQLVIGRGGDAEVRSQESITASRERSARLMFPVEAAARTEVAVRLIPEGFDALGSDNEAFAVLSPPRPLDVYVSPALTTYRHALRGIRGLRVFPAGDDEAGPGDYDLMIVDKAEVEGVSARTSLYVGVMPQGVDELIDVNQDGDGVIDWRRGERLLDHVEFGEVMLIEQVRWREGAGEDSLENLGYEALAYGQFAPLILSKHESGTSGGRQSYYLLFHTDRSTMPYRIGFPIMVANLVRVAMREAGLLEVEGDRTGVIRPGELQANTTYDLSGPGGYARREVTDDQGQLLGVPAPRVGVYTLDGGGDEVHRVGVSLLRPAETSLASVDEIRFQELSVGAAAEATRVDRVLWPMFATLALGMLLVEWWFFQRRPGVLGRE